MNRRTMKKIEKRAMARLITEFDYPASNFFMADGEESIDAPTKMEGSFVSGGFLSPGPLKGTPLVEIGPSYMYGEYDIHLPSDILRDYTTDWGAMLVALEPPSLIEEVEDDHRI